MGLRSLKPTPNALSFRGSRIGFAKAFWALATEITPWPSWADQHPFPVPRTAPTELLDAVVCKGTGNATRAAHTSPTAPLVREATQAIFARSPPQSNGQSGAGLPLAPWALMLCWGSPAPETHPQSFLLRGEAGLGLRRPSSPRPQQCPASQAGLHSTEAPAPQRHQTSSWRLQSAKGQEKVLGQHTPAPPRLCSGKQRKPFLHPARHSPSGKAGLGCLWLPGPRCFVGVLRSLKPTLNVFSFTGKQDLAGEGHLGPDSSNAPEASWVAQPRDSVSPMAPNQLLGAAVCKGTGNIPRGATPAPPRLC